MVGQQFNKTRPHLWWMLSLCGLALIFALLTSGILSNKTSQTSALTVATPALATPPIPFKSLENSPATNYQPLLSQKTPSFDSLFSSQILFLFSPQHNIDLEPEEPATVSSWPQITNKPLKYKPASTEKTIPIQTEHIVRQGEILASIAAQYDVPLEAIITLNPLAETTLEVGQKLLIPENRLFKPQTVQYRVQEGDTLLKIAARHGSSINDIIKSNPGLSNAPLQPSSLISVPIIFTPEQLPQPAYSPTVAQGSQRHLVKAGETPLSIAELYQVPVEILLAVNEINNPRHLRLGENIIIPPAEGLTLGFPTILHETKAKETLLGIVSKYGSSVKNILDINPDLIPASLEAGQIVAVPIIFPSQNPDPQPTKTRPSLHTPPPPSIPHVAQEIVQVINEHRQAHNLPSLQPHAKLNEIATEHAQDMVVRRFFDHTNPDGRTLRRRLQARNWSNTYYVGENIQRNSRPESEVATVTVNWFMGSAPHRRNLLHPQYHRLGVGVVKSADESYTIVVDFSE